MENTATKIRLFEEGDYESIVRINNALFPEFPEAVEELARHDEQRRLDMKDPDKPIKWLRWVLEEEGRVAAYGGYSQSPWIYHPRKFKISMAVQPEFQRRGLGKALYDHIMKAVMVFDPIKLSAWTCAEKVPQTPGFLERRGYRAGMKTWDSKLDLASWDPASFAGEVTRALEQGISLVSLDKLMETMPDWDRKIYEMERDIWKDIPLPDEQTDPGFEWFKRQILESPNLYLEASWFALDGDLPVSMSALWKSKADNHLSTGLTGTARSHRRRGIATALKVKALSYAKAQGHPYVNTDNEENNVGMIGINKLGFVDYPSWQCFELILKEEA